MSPQASHNSLRLVHQARNVPVGNTQASLPVPPRLLLTLPEVCTALSLGRSSVNTLIWSGEIPSIRIGRSRRVSLGDLESWIETRKANDTD
jgi:excisionase family DNA binding protein